MLAFILIVGVLIAIYFIVNSQKRKKEEEQRRLENERIAREQQEQEAKRLEAERIAKEKKEFAEAKHKEYADVLSELYDMGMKDENTFISTDEPAYKKFISCRESAMQQKETMQIWGEDYKKFITTIDDDIKSEISSIAAHYQRMLLSVRIEWITRYLKIIKLVVNTNDYDDTIQKLKETAKTLNLFLESTYYIDQPFNDERNCYEYGVFHFLEDSSDEEVRPEDLSAEILSSDMDKAEEHFSQLYEIGKEKGVNFQIYKSLAEYITDVDYRNSAIAMWCFAANKPFDVSKFEKACKISSWYISYDEIQSLEVMIVRIYNWKSIGGANVVKEYSRDILNWVEETAQYFSDQKTGEKYGSLVFYHFVSALAWMELYDIELMVLKKLVDLKVQLWEDAQERLKFLSSGGTANVQIYTPVENVFSFDTSAAEWKDNEIDVFFRKIKMKNIPLEYSLVRKKWTKTYPLQTGQEYSADALYAEFSKMVDDFDGEVTLTREDAVALNTKNVRYSDAMIFHFISERNRCISMLFHAEKFGKNLNITILTLFTPEKNVPVEDLERYAIAIKNNVYAESFQESILESLDRILKVQTEAYEDTTTTNENAEVDFSGFFD